MKVNEVYQVIFKELGVTIDQVKSNDNDIAISDARYIIFMLMRGDYDFQEIADAINKNKTTIYHYSSKLNMRLRTNKGFNKRVKKVYASLGSKFEDKAEYSIGDQVEFGLKRFKVYPAKEPYSCEGCFFQTLGLGCQNYRMFLGVCQPKLCKDQLPTSYRSDGRSIIFKMID